ncbi:MAG: TIGR02449 family protein [Cellvibrionaceae bacterium]|nr:TIGR02449 family protein [Cellvibrionaceae bacterium]
MSERLIAEVEAKLEQLVQRCQQLDADNRRLRQQEQEWASERSRLMETNELARTRIESLITRLKQFENYPE